MDNIGNSSNNRKNDGLKEFTKQEDSEGLDLEILVDTIYYQLKYIIPYLLKSSDKSTFARNVGNFLNWILGISTTITVLVIGNFNKLLVVENNETFLYMKSDFIWSLICLLVCVVGITILRIYVHLIEVQLSTFQDFDALNIKLSQHVSNLESIRNISSKYDLKNMDKIRLISNNMRVVEISKEVDEIMGDVAVKLDMAKNLKHIIYIIFLFIGFLMYGFLSLCYIYINYMLTYT